MSINVIVLLVAYLFCLSPFLYLFFRFVAFRYSLKSKIKKLKKKMIRIFFISAGFVLGELMMFGGFLKKLMLKGRHN